jgi:hypothetical protein
MVDFIVIGPGKCGTSWLYGVVESAPDVQESSVKETLFFTEFYNKGYDYYHSHFNNKNKNIICGEFSNTYISTAGVAAKIFKYNSKVKIISTVRNPIERTISHYLWIKRNSSKVESFSKEIRKQNCDIVEKSKYSKMLDEYYSCFPGDQIKVMIFDDLVANEKNYSNSFLKFIGSSSTYQKIASKHRLPASKARYLTIVKIYKKASKIARKYGFPSIVQKAKQSFLYDLAFKSVLNTDYPDISKRDINYLVDIYFADTVDLSKRLNRDLTTEWFSKEKIDLILNKRRKND